MSADVISFDPQARAAELAAELVAGWRRLPRYVLLARCEALRAMQANGVRLSTDAYDAWLQMSATIAAWRVR